MAKSPQNNDLKKGYTAYGKILSLLFQAIILMLVFAFAGNWADKYFQHKMKFLTILGVFLGMSVGFYNLIKNGLDKD
jgi:F0F1-type ATP synthase assembly protein I